VLLASREPAKVRPLALDNGAALELIAYLFSNGSIALLALVGLYSLSGKHDRSVWLAWFWTLGVVGGALVINAWLGVLFSIRHLMGLWPALALIAGIGIDRLARAGVKPVVLLALWAISGVWITVNPTSYASLRQPYAHLHWGQLAEALRGRVGPDDAILYLLPYPANSLLHKKVSDYYLHGLVGNYAMLESPRLIGERGFEAAAEKAVQAGRRLWIGYDASQPPDYLYQLDTILIKSRVVCGTIANTPQLHLNLYAPLPGQINTLRFQFGDGLSLTPLTPSLVIDGKLSVLLGLALAPELPRNTYSVALHVEDQRQKLVAQTDFALPNEAFACHATAISVDNLPAGDYTLLAVVYRWDNNERLPGLDTRTQTQADRLVIGGFRLP
jgi:hypothetical protein